MNAIRKQFIVTAILLVPAAGALAAADPFDGYQRGIAGAGPTHAVVGTMATGTACGRDPFAGYRQAFNTGGPVQNCDAMAAPAGAQGSAGPAMVSAWDDPFQDYRRGISAD